MKGGLIDPRAGYGIWTDSREPDTLTVHATDDHRAERPLLTLTREQAEVLARRLMEVVAE